MSDSSQPTADDRSPSVGRRVDQMCNRFEGAWRGFTPAGIAQPMYNLLARRIEDELLPACEAFGVSVIA